MVFKMCHYLIGLFNFLHKIYKYIIRAYFFRLYFLCTLFYTLLLEMLYRKMFMYLCKESQIKLVPTILSYNEFIHDYARVQVFRGGDWSWRAELEFMPALVLYCIVVDINRRIWSWSHQHFDRAELKKNLLWASSTKQIDKSS